MSRLFTSDSPSISEIKRRKKPNRRTVSILMDPDLKHEKEWIEAEIDQLREKARNSRSGDLSSTVERDLEKKRAELGEVLRQAEESTAHFVFQDIGQRAFNDLVKDTPPTEEDKQLSKENGWDPPEFDLNKFPRALIAACIVSPKMTARDVDDIFDGYTYTDEETGEEVEVPSWSEGELVSLWMGALMACKEQASVPFSENATAQSLISELKSTTALSGESPTDSS